MKLRAVIADDEPLARARLRRLLEDGQGVEIVAECASGDEAVAAVHNLQPDVVFLDIRMPDLDGFGVLGDLNPARRPCVVFVTAYADHALRAFDADAVDYLLKPYSSERLQAALARVRRMLASDPLRADAVRNDYLQRLAVPVGARMQLLPVAVIYCVVAQANYVELHANGRSFLLRATMAGLEARLDPRLFVRVHRSRIVRLDAIRDIEPLDSGQYLLRLADGMRIATGRSYRDKLREALGLGASV